jgi:hypothetical protein
VTRQVRFLAQDSVPLQINNGPARHFPFPRKAFAPFRPHPQMPGAPFPSDARPRISLTDAKCRKLHRTDASAH